MTPFAFQSFREVQDEPTTNAPSGQPSVRFAGLIWWNDLGDSEGEHAFFSLLPKLIEEHRVVRKPNDEIG